MYIMMNVGGSVVQIMNVRIIYLGSHVKIHLKSWEIPAKLYKHNIFK
jgi:hypothetical protein